MSQQPPNKSGESPPPWQPRFGLGAMMLVMLVICVAAAAASYLVRSFRADALPSAKLIFLLFTLVAPVILLVAIRLGRMLIIWLTRP